MKTLVIGFGNLLLSDEGFGIHFIRYLEESRKVPEGVELLDGGTTGLFSVGRLEQAERVYIVDALSAPGQPGAVLRYTKHDFLSHKLPLKLSPHQAGVQEMLQVSEMRGTSPAEVHLFGVIPLHTEPGCGLSEPAQQALVKLAAELISEIGGDDHDTRLC